MSYVAAPIAVPRELWSGLQPKIFLQNNLPKINPALIEWRTPEEIARGIPREMAQAKQNGITSFCNILGLNAEESETFRDKALGSSVFYSFAEILYARCSKKLDSGFGLSPVTTDEITAIGLKIKEGIGNCLAGFIDRLQGLVNTLTHPKTFDDFLCAVRVDLVTRCAASHSGGEIHANTRFAHIAAPIYRTPTPVDDPYVGLITPENIRFFLSSTFKENFNFFGILAGLTELLKSRLVSLEYIGSRPSYKNKYGLDMFYSNHIDTFLPVLHGLFSQKAAATLVTQAGAGAGAGSGTTAEAPSIDSSPSEIEQWFCIEEDQELCISYPIDLNWFYILQHFVTILISEGYIRVKSTEFELLNELELYNPRLARQPLLPSSFAPVDQTSFFQCHSKVLIEFFISYPTIFEKILQKSKELRDVFLSSTSNTKFMLFQLIKDRSESVEPFLELIKACQPETLPILLNGKKITPLMAAAYRGNSQLVAALLTHGANVNIKNPKGISAISYAIASGSSTSTLKLLEAGASASSETLTKALHLAAQKADMALWNCLMPKIGKITLLDPLGNSAFVTAIRYQQFDFAAEILQTHPSFGSSKEIKRKNTHGLTALDICFLSNAPTTLIARLFPNSPKSQKMSYGRTFLMEATKHGNTETVDFLLERGAKVTDYNQNRDTALNFAIEDKHWDTASQLLNSPSASAAICVKLTRHVNIRKLTPLMLAVSREPEAPLDFIKLLLSKGAAKDLNYVVRKNNEDLTALDIALKHNHIKTALFLIECGAELSAYSARKLFEHELTKTPDQMSHIYIHALLRSPGVVSIDDLDTALSQKAIWKIKFILETHPDFENEKLPTQGKTLKEFLVENPLIKRELELCERGSSSSSSPPVRSAVPTAFSYPSYDQALSDFLISVERLRLISASPPESFNPWICRVIAQLPQRITPRNLEPHEVLSILKNLGLHKYKIYEIIKNLKDPELKLKTLDAILTRAPQDPDSLGAQLFWKKRKFTHKSTEKGTLQKLKEMHDELKAQLKTQAVSAFSFHQSPVHDVRPTVAVIPQGAGAPAGGAGIGAGMGALSVI